MFLCSSWVLVSVFSRSVMVIVTVGVVVVVLVYLEVRMIPYLLHCIPARTIFVFGFALISCLFIYMLFRVQIPVLFVCYLLSTNLNLACMCSQT